MEPADQEENKEQSWEKIQLGKGRTGTRFQDKGWQ